MHVGSTDSGAKDGIKIKGNVMDFSVALVSKASLTLNKNKRSATKTYINYYTK